jgi:small subunit ribosomal protein S20
MANSLQSKKRARQETVRHARNMSLRSRAFTQIKKARNAIFAGEKDKAQTEVKAAFSEIDRMVPKGVFHKNRAARLKSRLNASLKKLVLA